jgi:arabinofuranosyltransferase
LTITHAQRERRVRGVRRRAAQLWPEIAAVVIASGFYSAFIARSRFTFRGQTYFGLHDDAMISMRYARNLAEGHGLTWSGGEKVEGYTNFLWTLWMSLVHLLRIPDSKTSVAIMITSAALLVGTMVVVRLICARLAPDRRWVGVAAMVLTGLFYPLVYWSLRGMEVGLAAFLVALMALLALRHEAEPSTRTSVALGGVAALAVLTRDDLLLPCVVVAAYAVWASRPGARRRVLAIVGGALLVAVAAHVAFRLAYYGDALPNTYYLKLGGVPVPDRLLRGGEGLAYTWLFTLYAPFLLALAYLVARGRAVQRGALLLAALVAVQAAYSLYVGGDAWEAFGFANRYITTAAPLLMVLTALGVGELVTGHGRRLIPWLAGALALMAVVVSNNWLPVGRLKLIQPSGLRPFPIAVALLGAALVFALRRARRGPALVAVAVALVAVVVVQVDSAPVRDWARRNAQGYSLESYWARAGLVLRETTSPRTTVAVIGAGNTPYFSHRPSVDLLGKMDPVIAHGPMRGPLWPGHSKWNYAHSIGRLRPDVITLLWGATPDEICAIRTWGYRPVVHELLVREGAPGIRGAELERRYTTLHAPTRWFDLPKHCPQS